MPCRPPAAQEVVVRTPLVNADSSVTIDLVAPVDVRSLRHEVVIRKAEDQSEVAKAGAVLSSYRSPALAPGDYEVTVVGYNGHTLTPARAPRPPR
jgi:hypothetical protein